MKKLAILTLLTFSLTACGLLDFLSNDTNPGIEGESEMQVSRQVTGEVIEFIGDCAFDGICAYVVETDSGEAITVIWVEGDSPICQNDPFQGGDSDIVVGDSIDSLGRVIDDSTTSACGDPSYYIRKTN